MRTSPFPSWLLLGLIFSVGPVLAVDFVAHRGASHAAPENTLAAQRLAWEERADAVETDIRLTQDGRILVIHDATTLRTAGRDAKVIELTLAEARGLDAGSWKAPQYAGEKLPTLDEQLALIPPGKKLLVEIKVGPEIVPELARVVAKAGVDLKQLVVISFNHAALQAVREQLPQVATLKLAGYTAPTAQNPTPDQPTLDAVIAAAREAGFTGLDLHHGWPLTLDDVKKIRAANLQLHVWTVDDVAVAERWIALGVDSITTNRPGWLRESLKR